MPHQAGLALLSVAVLRLVLPARRWPSSY